MINFQIVDKIEDFHKAFPILLNMYPNYTENDLKKLLKDMLPLNYKILLCYIDNKVIGLTGFWIATKFWSGKYCEIDNFFIDETYRNKGFGHQIVDFVFNLAKKENCLMVTLDAYTHNFKAHKFFYKEGFLVKGFHFVKDI